MNSCFTCLNCGRNNPSKANSYTNKYCNNSCQQQHRSRLLIQEWKENEDKIGWKQVPDYIRKYLISIRGHICSICSGKQHNNGQIPLIVDHIDRNTHNNSENNLRLICPNCRAQK